MSAPDQSVAVQVDLLRPGLHVHALDRPWVETPFVFQGFRITGDAELDVLRAYCRHVYVDLGQSEPAAAEAVLRAGGRPALRPEQLGAGLARVQAPAPADLPATRSAGVLFEPVPHPDRARFRAAVHAAATSRTRTHRAVKDALARARQRRVVDVAAVEDAVDEMAELVAADPAAALWLTQLAVHDDYTATHSVNACVLALAFGRYLGFEGGHLRNLGLGTLLMDVGKVTVPPGVLDRPRSLSATEWAFVKRHVAMGFELLAESELPAEALDVVRMHHERRSGNGYPRGLGGDQIPRQALLAGLADSYDAMLRDRPHRAAMSQDRAVQTLYARAETTFGHDLVEAFIRYLGSYPVGTLVRLDNDAVAIVVANRPGAGLWPTVLLLRNADGAPFRKRRLLNLAAANEPGAETVARYVRRTLTPRQANVDVGKLVAREFGLALG